MANMKKTIQVICRYDEKGPSIQEIFEKSFEKYLKQKWEEEKWSTKKEAKTHE